MSYDEPDFYGPPDRLFSNRHPLADLELVVDFLAQGEKWCQGDGSYVEVSEMTPGHAAMTVAFLLRRARDVAVVYNLATSSNTGWDTTVSDDRAREWLLTQKLLVELSARARFGVAAETLRPWER